MSTFPNVLKMILIHLDFCGFNLIDSQGFPSTYRLSAERKLLFSVLMEKYVADKENQKGPVRS